MTIRRLHSRLLRSQQGGHSSDPVNRFNSPGCQGRIDTVPECRPLSALISFPPHCLRALILRNVTPLYKWATHNTERQLTACVNRKRRTLLLPELTGRKDVLCAFEVLDCRLYV